MQTRKIKEKEKRLKLTILALFWNQFGGVGLQIQSCYRFCALEIQVRNFTISIFFHVPKTPEEKEKFQLPHYFGSRILKR